MSTAASKELVIDASVAHVAGLTEHGNSAATRHFLRAVLEVCHRMILTPPLSSEWRHHQSKSSREWRKAMHARRKIRILKVAPENSGLRERVLRGGDDEELRQIRLKDLPLIEAALHADRIVVSLDEEARASFQIAELAQITWVNPVKEQEQVLPWLEAGAPSVDEWKLSPREPQG